MQLVPVGISVWKTDLVKPISLYLPIAENKPNYLWKTKNQIKQTTSKTTKHKQKKQAASCGYRLKLRLPCIGCRKLLA